MSQTNQVIGYQEYQPQEESRIFPSDEENTPHLEPPEESRIFPSDEENTPHLEE